MATKNKTVSPVDRIAALTAERTRLQEQADLVAAAPRALAEAVADVPRAVAQLAERFDPIAVGYLAGGPAGVGDLVHALSSRNQSEYQLPSPGEFLAWCAPQQLASALERHLTAVYETLPAPLTTAARATELARLSDQIRAIEGEIASAWWGATDCGMSLPPPDIRGDVLIGLSAP